MHSSTPSLGVPKDEKDVNPAMHSSETQVERMDVAVTSESSHEKRSASNSDTPSGTQNIGFIPAADVQLLSQPVKKMSNSLVKDIRPKVVKSKKTVVLS